MVGKPVNYFGYGANRVRSRLEQIIARRLSGGEGAILSDYSLCFQSVDQIPSPARELMMRIWGKTFRCYSILPQPRHLTAGVIWVLRPDELELIKTWEFVGVWKELIQVTVTTAKGLVVNAWTEKVLPGQRVTWYVDGLSYENNLNREKVRVDDEEEYRIEQIKEARRELESLARAAKERAVS